MRPITCGTRVQKLHHTRQLVGNPVGHEQEPDAFGRKVNRKTIPERFHNGILVGVGVRLQEFKQGIIGIVVVIGLEIPPYRSHSHRLGGVGGVVQHLTHHGSAYFAVGTAFHFHKSRYGVLVNHEVVN